MANNSEPKVWTILDVLKWTVEYLKSKSIESPRLKTELLLCKLLDCERIDIYSNFDKPMSSSELKKFREWVQRAGKRESVQMIIGEVNFSGLKLLINNSAIVPRPETEQMIEIIKNDYPAHLSFKILDIGCGSGCIGLSLAHKFKASSVVCIDISPAAISLAEQNAKLNNIDNVTFLTMDVSKYRFLEKFDLIVSNPPYIEIDEYNKLDPEVKEWEPREALTDEGDGLKFYRIFSELFVDILSANGRFYLENSWNQSSRINEIFESKKFHVETIKDFQGFDRFVKGKFPE